jgi:hypothetical protein
MASKDGIIIEKEFEKVTEAVFALLVVGVR